MASLSRSKTAETSAPPLRLYATDADSPRPGERSAPVLIAEADGMRALLDQARRVAASKASVLIEGESGTGKELVARLIHEASPRAGRPFIRVNCAALSEGLIESELFGHERGAFTGAEKEHAGRFERANGGTLLLDEIGEMPLRLQAKLLRVLEQEEFERVGGAAMLAIDVRVLATTNRCLERECTRGTFRSDLFYRLGAVAFRLPPLRARRDELPALVRHFIGQYGRDAGAAVDDVSPRALELMQAYRWPGNVRQLRNVIQRACLLARGPRLEPDDLHGLTEPPPEAAADSRTLAEIERQVILATLRELGGNKTAAARRLGVTPRTLLNKLKQYRADGA